MRAVACMVWLLVTSGAIGVGQAIDRPRSRGCDEMDEFEAHRAHLRAVATRILGSRAEADDALQEAWIRVDRADTSDVDNIGGWLTTVVSRVCLTCSTRASAAARRRSRTGGCPTRSSRARRRRAGPGGRGAGRRRGRRSRCSSCWRRCSPRSGWRSCCTTCSRCRSRTSRRSSTARPPPPGSSRRGRGAASRAPTATRPPPTARGRRRVPGRLPRRRLRGPARGARPRRRPARRRRRRRAAVVKGAREVADRARLAAGARRVHAAIVDGAAGFVATEAGVPVAVLAFRVAGGRITGDRRAGRLATRRARPRGLRLELAGTLPACPSSRCCSSGVRPPCSSSAGCAC